MRIAIVKLSSIGDIAQNAFISQVLNKHYPHITVDWFCEESFVEILEPNETIANVYGVISKKPHKRIGKFIGQFFSLQNIGKKNRYNVVMDLQGTFKSAMVAKVICTNNNLWGFANTRDFLAPKFYKKHFKSSLAENVYVRAINAINEALGLQATIHDMQVPFIHTYCEDVVFAAGVKCVLIFPSSSVQRKNYSIENWVKLIKMLPNVQITLLYGSENEKQICEKIANGCKNDCQQKIVIVGGKKLAEIKTLLLDQHCVIAADTGIAHIACGLGVKTITLYGPTPQYRTFMHKENSKTLQGNGDVNKIPAQQVVQMVKFLIG